MRQLLPMALSLVLALPAAAKSPEPPKEGDKAPEFSLPSQDGTAVSLESLKGKWVVLYFYPKDFTGGCTLEARGFQKKLAEFETRGATVVGVSGQSAKSHKEFCEKESLSFRLLADEKREVSRAYGSLMLGGLLSARNTFLLSPAGSSPSAGSRSPRRARRRGPGRHRRAPREEIGPGAKRPGAQPRALRASRAVNDGA
ncbi:MAG: peroxiredoxin [Elusimicrobiota bacterium]|nr:MAG: peroxiredoxin [Elusimicrobiota bacterium]